MKVINLGLIDYKDAIKVQENMVEQLRLEENEEHLLFCSHPPVVTLGKKTQPEDLGAWKGETLQVTRGGRATYHGPSQVICYPIVRMKPRNNDIHKYLRNLEEAMVMTLKNYGVRSFGDESSTGVWVSDRKIASIGIAIKRGITYHGLALNLYRDEEAFKGINPCGMGSNTMISLEEILGQKTLREEFEDCFLKNLLLKLRIENFL